MTIDYIEQKLSPGAARRGCRHITWTLANGEMGTPFELGSYSDYSIHCVGTAGVGLSWTFYGSNLPAPTVIGEFVALTDPQGGAITKSAKDVIEQAEEITRWATPKVTAGDGSTDIDIHLFCRM